MSSLVLSRTKTGRRLFLFMALSLAFLVLEGTTSLIERPRDILSFVMEPAHRAAALPYQAADLIRAYLGDRSTLRRENRRLKLEVLELAAEAMQLRHVGKEYGRLQNLLHLDAARLAGYRIAEVIGETRVSSRQEVVVSAGLSDGIGEGLPVIDERGVYGRVIDSSQSVSTVMLLTDLRFGVPAEVERTGVRGIVVGTGGRTLNMDIISTGPDVRRGDQLITSGMGTVYPKGIHIGEVEGDPTVRSDGTLEIEIAPAAAIDSSKYVLIFLDPDRESR